MSEHFDGDRKIRSVCNILLTLPFTILLTLPFRFSVFDMDSEKFGDCPPPFGWPKYSF